MVKKNLFKKITALSLSLCLAITPTMAYAGDFSADEEIIMMDDASEGETLAVEEESADFTEPVVVEDAASEDESLAGGDDLEWTDDVVVIEDSSVEEKTFGVDEDTMAILQEGAVDIEESFESADLADTVVVTFDASGGTISNWPTKQYAGKFDVTKSVATPLPTVDRKNVKKASSAFKGWGTSSGTSTVTYKDGANVTFSSAQTLYAVWGDQVAKRDNTNIYASIGDAVDGAEYNDTITLIADDTSTTAVSVDKTVTLATAGKSVKPQISVAPGGALTITGDGEFASSPTASSSGGKLVIQGGIYPSNVIAYCDTGYYVTPYKETATSTQKYKVINNAVAKIGDLYYATLAEAIEAAGSSSGAVTITILDDINEGLPSGLVVKNNLTITSGKKVNDEIVNVNVDATGNVRFDGTVTIDKNVILDKISSCFRGAVTVNGHLGGNNAGDTYILGSTLTVPKTASFVGDNVYGIYGSTISVTGDLGKGYAIEVTTAPTTSDLFTADTLSLGNRGANTFNLTDGIAVVSDTISGTDDGENGGYISNDLASNYSYKPTSIPANAASNINLDNAVLAGKAMDFGTAGVGKNVTLRNKSWLYVTDELKLTKNDAIYMGYDSKIKVGTWINNGTLYVDVAGLDESDLPVAVVTATSTLTESGKVVLQNNKGFGVETDTTGKVIKIVKAAAQLTHGSTITPYSDLNDAITDAKDGDVVTLLDSVGTDTAFAITGKKITLDLNGNSITSSAVGITVSGSAELTVKAAYPGTIKGTEGITVADGKVKLESGTIEGSSSYAIEMTDKKSVVDIAGGTITGKVTTHVGGGILASKGTLTVSGGTFTNKENALHIGFDSALSNSELANVTITGGTFETDLGAITVKDYFGSVAVTSTLTKIINAVDGPNNYVWTTSGSTSKLVSFVDAMAKSDAGSTVKLIDNVTLSSAEKADVSKNITLDLNGATLSDASGQPYLIGVKRGGKLTIINTSADSGTINSAREMTIRMNPNVMNTTDAAAELVVGSTDTSLNDFTINGKYVISGEKNYPKTVVTVNGGEIVGTDTAIDTPQAGTVTVNKGDLTGVESALYIGSGATININDGYIGNGSNKQAVTIEQTSNGAAINVNINGGTFKGSETVINQTSDVTTKLSNINLIVSGGYFNNIANTGINAENIRGFLEGGRYLNEPNMDYVVDGATVASISGAYPYEIRSGINRYTLTATANPTAAASAPTVSPSTSRYASGTAVTVTAGTAASDYQFVGWFTPTGTTALSTSTKYTFNITANTELVAKYAKQLTIKAGDDTVATGSEYVGDKSKITVTGLPTGVTGVVNTANMTLTASTYNKDTSTVGSTHSIVPAGATINSTYTTQYVIKGYENGTLTVIEGTGPETFIADVAKLPAASAVTVDNLAATRTAVDTAKADYAKLSTASKDLADVKTAKTKLDAVEAAVVKLETDKAAADAVKAQIDALPAADKATSADKANADAAKAAYDALTDDQKKLISAADKKKLDDVKAAADKAAEDDKKAADAVATEVNALPALTDITLDDKDKIEKARADYDALSEAQKALIPDAKTKLEAAEEVLKSLEGDDQKKADEVSALISALPSPDNAQASDRAAVDAAKAAYNALTPAQQALVTPANKNKLNDVDKAVKDKEDQAAADEVAEMIADIKDAPAGEQKAAAQEARAAYYGLTTDQRDLLPDSALNDLEEAEAAFEEGRIFGLNGQRYKVLSNGDVTYHRPQDKETVESVNIPNQVKKGGYLFKVVKVSINAFNACPNLKWVVVGKNVKSLGKCAFKNTPKLKKIKFMGTQVTTATSAFTGAGSGTGKSKGANMTIFTKPSVVDEYESLFKGAGKLNAKATVTEME